MPARDSYILILTLICLNRGAIASLKAPAPAPEGHGRTLRVLVVGNSLSFENHGTYQVIANLLNEQFPDTAIEAVQISESGELLSEHLKKAETPGTYNYAALSHESIEHWDYVILQEESEQVAEGNESAAATRNAIAGLAKLAVARGARVGVVLTWAWLDGKNDKFPSFQDMQAKVNSGYVETLQAVREDTGIPIFLAPVGLGWQAVHDLLTFTSAYAPSQNSTRAAAAPGDAPSPTADSAAAPNTPQAAADATSPADAAAAPAAAPESASPAANPSAVASFVTAQKAKPVRQPRGVAAAAAPRDLALLTAICVPRSKPPAPARAAAPKDASAQKLPVATLLQRTPAPAPILAPAAAPNLAQAGTPQAGPPAAGTLVRPSQPPPSAAFGVAYTGRKLLNNPKVNLPESASQQQIAMGAGEAMHGFGGLSKLGARRKLLAASAAAAPKEASAEMHATAKADSGAADAVAPSPESAKGPEVTVPAEIKGDPVRSEMSLPARSASAPSSDSKGRRVNVCQMGEYPDSWDTFKDLYQEDGNHPSEKGTYLEGLIIASAMTGCRMHGNPYTRDLESKWVDFLQALSDAVVFKTSPPAFPQELWAPQGVQCALR